MKAGELISQGGARELLESPPDDYTAAFLAGMLILDAEVTVSPSGSPTIKTAIGNSVLKFQPPRGGKMRAAVPPTAISIGPMSAGGTNAKVRGLAFQRSGAVEVRLEVLGQVVVVPLREGLPVPAVGDYVSVTFDNSALRLFPLGDIGSNVQQQTKTSLIG
jgi:ABC-type Fe3+/spermidine/putrescine transport system ATPase subunit